MNHGIDARLQEHIARAIDAGEIVSPSPNTVFGLRNAESLSRVNIVDESPSTITVRYVDTGAVSRLPRDVVSSLMCACNL